MNEVEELATELATERTLHQQALAEIARLEKALSEIDNLASGAIRAARQVRKQAQDALGWDHDVG